MPHLLCRLRRFLRLTNGLPALLPEWAYGHWKSRDVYEHQRDVEDDFDGYRRAMDCLRRGDVVELHQPLHFLGLHRPAECPAGELAQDAGRVRLSAGVAELTKDDASFEGTEKAGKAKKVKFKTTVNGADKVKVAERLIQAGHAYVDEQSADELLNIYNADKNIAIRKQIIFALSQMGNQKAKEKLFEVARSGETIEERGESVFWIGQTSGARCG